MTVSPAYVETGPWPFLKRFEERTNNPHRYTCWHEVHLKLTSDGMRTPFTVDRYKIILSSKGDKIDKSKWQSLFVRGFRNKSYFSHYRGFKMAFLAVDMHGIYTTVYTTAATWSDGAL